MPVEWSSRARRDTRKLPEPNRARIVKALARFAETGHGDVKPLTDVDPPAYRLRVGEYRVFLAFERDTIFVLRVRHRRDAY